MAPQCKLSPRRVSEIAHAIHPATLITKFILRDPQTVLPAGSMHFLEALLTRAKKRSPHLVALCAPLLLAFACGKPAPASSLKTAATSQEIYDGFEAKSLSDVWLTTKVEKDAVVLQSEIVRSGSGAAKITLRQGDRREAASAGSLENERDELVERKDLYSPEDIGYSYAFSVFIPQDFPIVSTRLILAQLKQSDSGGAAKSDNPLIALRYVGGELSVSTQHDDKKITRYKTKEDIRGQWLDFVIHVKFSRTPGGFVRVSMNGHELFHYTGVTAYDEAGGYAKNSLFYFKMGLYRDRMPESMTAYFDEYRKHPLSAAELGEHP